MVEAMAEGVKVVEGVEAEPQLASEGTPPVSLAPPAAQGDGPAKLPNS